MKGALKGTLITTHEPPSKQPQVRKSHSRCTRVLEPFRVWVCVSCSKDTICPKSLGPTRIKPSLPSTSFRVHVDFQRLSVTLTSLSPRRKLGPYSCGSAIGPNRGPTLFDEKEFVRGKRPPGHQGSTVGESSLYSGIKQYTLLATSLLIPTLMTCSQRDASNKRLRCFLRSGWKSQSTRKPWTVKPESSRI